MNPSNASSAPGSATTSSSAQTTPTGDRAEDSAKLCESEFLKEQAVVAKAAIVGAFSELKHDLAKGADPRVWMKSHPWITLTSAAVAGFAAAATVVPSKEQQALRKLEAIERAKHRARMAEQPATSNGHGSDTKEPRGFVAVMMQELFQAIKPAIFSLISAHFTPPGAPMENPETESEGRGGGKDR